jgi:hypothetical protein
MSSFTPALASGSPINAGHEPRLEAGVRDEWTLEAVRSRPLILMEVPLGTPGNNDASWA